MHVWILKTWPHSTIFNVTSVTLGLQLLPPHFEGVIFSKINRKTPSDRTLDTLYESFILYTVDKELITPNLITFSGFLFFYVWVRVCLDMHTHSCILCYNIAFTSCDKVPTSSAHPVTMATRHNVKRKGW